MRLPRLAFLVGPREPRLPLRLAAAAEARAGPPGRPRASFVRASRGPGARALDRGNARRGHHAEQLLDVHRSTAARALGREKFLFLSGRAGHDADPSRPSSTRPPRPSRRLRCNSPGSRIASRACGSRPAARSRSSSRTRAATRTIRFTGLDLAAGDKPEATQALTDAPKVKHTLPVFDDAKRIAFTSNARNGKDMDLYVEALPAKKDTFAEARHRASPAVTRWPTSSAIA